MGLVAIAALVSVVSIASWTDISERRIPNWLCGANLTLGLLDAAYTAGLTGVAWGAAHVVAALAVTMGLFAAKIIGAGDAKFYASMAAWLPIQQGLLLLVAVAVAGAVLLAVFLATRLRGGASRTRAGDTAFDKLPYGVAVGVGGLAAVMLA